MEQIWQNCANDSAVCFEKFHAGKNNASAFSCIIYIETALIGFVQIAIANNIFHTLNLIFAAFTRRLQCYCPQTLVSYVCF